MPQLPLQLSPKLRRAYKGPYIIVKKTGLKSYIVRPEGGRKMINVGVDRLKKFISRKDVLFPMPTEFEPVDLGDKNVKDAELDADNQELLTEIEQQEKLTNTSNEKHDKNQEKNEVNKKKRNRSEDTHESNKRLNINNKRNNDERTNTDELIHNQQRIFNNDEQINENKITDSFATFLFHMLALMTMILS